MTGDLSIMTEDGGYYFPEVTMSVDPGTSADAAELIELFTQLDQAIHEADIPRADALNAEIRSRFNASRKSA